MISHSVVLEACERLADCFGKPKPWIDRAAASWAPHLERVDTADGLLDTVDHICRTAHSAPSLAELLGALRGRGSYKAARDDSKGCRACLWTGVRPFVVHYASGVTYDGVAACDCERGSAKAQTMGDWYNVTEAQRKHPSVDRVVVASREQPSFTYEERYGRLAAERRASAPAGPMAASVARTFMDAQEEDRTRPLPPHTPHWTDRDSYLQDPESTTLDNHD